MKDVILFKYQFSKNSMDDNYGIYIREKIDIPIEKTIKTIFRELRRIYNKTSKDDMYLSSLYMLPEKAEYSKLPYDKINELQLGLSHVIINTNGVCHHFFNIKYPDYPFVLNYTYDNKLKIYIIGDMTAFKEKDEIKKRIKNYLCIEDTSVALYNEKKNNKLDYDSLVSVMKSSDNIQYVLFFDNKSELSDIEVFLNKIKGIKNINVIQKSNNNYYHIIKKDGNIIYNKF